MQQEGLEIDSVQVNKCFWFGFIKATSNQFGAQAKLKLDKRGVFLRAAKSS